MWHIHLKWAWVHCIAVSHLWLLMSLPLLPSANLFPLLYSYLFSRMPCLSWNVLFYWVLKVTSNSVTVLCFKKPRVLPLFSMEVIAYNQGRYNCNVQASLWRKGRLRCCDCVSIRSSSPEVGRSHPKHSGWGAKGVKGAALLSNAGNKWLPTGGWNPNSSQSPAWDLPARKQGWIKTVFSFQKSMKLQGFHPFT